MALNIIKVRDDLQPFKFEPVENGRFKLSPDEGQETVGLEARDFYKH